MTKKERQALRDDFVHKKMSEDPNISYEMAIMLFNWNTDHPEDKIKDSLLRKVQKKVKKNGGDVGKLVTVNKITRDKELKRILGKDFLRSVTKDEFFKGFWRNYVINILKEDKTIDEIRKENFELHRLKRPERENEDMKSEIPRSEIGPQAKARNEKKVNVLYEAKKRYPQFDYLSEEVQAEILEEIKNKLERKNAH